ARALQLAPAARRGRRGRAHRIRRARGAGRGEAGGRRRASRPARAAPRRFAALRERASSPEVDRKQARLAFAQPSSAPDLEREIEVLAAVVELGVALAGAHRSARRLDFFDRAPQKDKPERPPSKFGKALPRGFRRDLDPSALPREAERRAQKSARRKGVGDAVVLVEVRVILTV